MGTVYEEDSSVSILLRYSSDNDTPDMIFPAEPPKCQTISKAKPPAPSPPSSPLSIQATTTFSTSSENLYATRTPSPLPDSPMPIRKCGYVPDIKQISVLSEKKEEMFTFTDDEDTDSVIMITPSRDVITVLPTSPDTQNASLLKSVVCRLRKLKLTNLKKSSKRKNLRKMHVRIQIEGDGLPEVFKEYEVSPGCGFFFWMPKCINVVVRCKNNITKLKQRMEQWIQAYAGRPETSTHPRLQGSVADREQKQAEDFVNNNKHVPLLELMKQNLELQRLKKIEYTEKRIKKAPSLDDQPRGENGRIIYSQEYIDYVCFQEFQPLVDLRVLKTTATEILSRMSEEERNQYDQEFADKLNLQETPSVKRAHKNDNGSAGVRQGRATAQIIRSVWKWTINISRRNRVRSTPTTTTVLPENK